jgi:hypothetical protein
MRKTSIPTAKNDAAPSSVLMVIPLKYSGRKPKPKIRTPAIIRVRDHFNQTGHPLAWLGMETLVAWLSLELIRFSMLLGSWRRRSVPGLGEETLQPQLVVSFHVSRPERVAQSREYSVLVLLCQDVAS